MSSTNLTREESAARRALLAVSHYDITLDLSAAEDHSSPTFRSITKAHFSTDHPGSTFIDLRAESVQSVVLDGHDITAQAVPTDAAGKYLEEDGIRLDNLGAGEHVLEIDALCIYSRAGQGLHRFLDSSDGQTYLYSQCETADAKRIFACFDQPNLKATYSWTFLTPAGWEMITNAPVDTTAVEAGVVKHTSEITYPLSTYLIAVCAGPYRYVEDSWTGHVTEHHADGSTSGGAELTVPLRVYCRASLFHALDGERIFTETKQGFDYYHRHFGIAYPYGKYDQIFVPEFNAGAMENSGAVTIRDEYVFTSQATHYRYERRADTILHELAHMWFGDLVTMDWWNDLWLNESFATWAAAMSQAENTEYDTAWVTFSAVEKAWAYQQDQLPSTHPVSTDASDIETVIQNFDGITYAKGASVLKQLQAYVGREAFFAGTRRYFEQHAWGNATFDDLLGALQEASGRDLSNWAEQWLLTTGISGLHPEFEVSTDGTYSSFTVVQTGPTMRTHRIAVGLYAQDAQTGAINRTHRVEVDITGERTTVAELAGLPAADLVLVNDDDLTYCLMGLDEASKALVVEKIDKIADPMARALCWSAAWEMTREGTMAARDFVRLVAKGASAETEMAVLEAVVAQARQACARFAEPNWRELRGVSRLTEAFLEGAHEVNEHRALVFLKALCRLPLTTVAQGFMEHVWRGTSPFGKDPEARWEALTALISSAVLSPEEAAAEIAALAAEDPTSAGRLSAIRATAAIPTPEAAHKAWDAAVSGELSNLELRSTIEGLTWAGWDREALLRPFTEVYFEQAEHIWKVMSQEVADATLVGLYPASDVSEETLARADALLSRPISSGLARPILENRDRMARALRLRAVDAALGKKEGL